ncbi:MAG: sigma-70 family RNA polymerase sigma factor [Bacteroidetes bacterium]|nr:sigma-70 family RNA polymerase sigma factor [Bacteroidota bacterium]
MKFREDQYYIERVLGGDTTSYRPLVEKHQDLVFTIVHRIVASTVEAEEVAQDVFIKAYKKLHDFQGKAKFSTWLYRIAYNTAISHSRKKKVVVLTMEENTIENYSVDEMCDDIMGLSALKQKKLIHHALSVLPRTDNLIISLFYFHEKDIEEIGDIIGMTSNNVKVKLFRIRKKLLREMNKMIDQDINTVA